MQTFERKIDESFQKHLSDAYAARIRSVERRLRYSLDRLIYKDEEEFLEGSDLDPDQRWQLVQSLSRLNDRSGYHAIFLREIERLIRGFKLSDPKAPLKILDVGAGGGGLLRAIHRWAKKKKRPVDLHGIDLSPEFICRTKAHLDKQGVPVTLQQADASQLHRFSDNSFDIVVSSYMVHHLRTAGRVASFLSQTHRVARRGWLLVDFDRRSYGPPLVRILGTLFGGHPLIVTDGVKSIRRAYKVSEINFILQQIRKHKLLKGMICESYPVLPYWLIRGFKVNV
ncbi:MAG: methyltransferase domain-containing protein [Candidatus Omnitrophota bacterium]|nr:methyltransferase domain-containing protein [Candidatus Omnitrophota bacterium]